MPLGVIIEVDFTTGRGVIDSAGQRIPFSWKDVVSRSMKGLETGTQVFFQLKQLGERRQALAVQRYEPQHTDNG